MSRLAGRHYSQGVPANDTNMNEAHRHRKQLCSIMLQTKGKRHNFLLSLGTAQGLRYLIFKIPSPSVNLQCSADIVWEVTSAAKGRRQRICCRGGQRAALMVWGRWALRLARHRNTTSRLVRIYSATVLSAGRSCASCMRVQHAAHRMRGLPAVRPADPVRRCYAYELASGRVYSAPISTLPARHVLRDKIGCTSPRTPYSQRRLLCCGLAFTLIGFSDSRCDRTVKEPISTLLCEKFRRGCLQPPCIGLCCALHCRGPPQQQD